jgi:hypothetical protein
VSWLGKLAAADAVPVFPAVGRDALAGVEDLGLDPRVRLVASPREAMVLLVAGDTGAEAATALERVHDQLPHPRATLWWGARPDPRFTDPAVVPEGETPTPALKRLQAGLLAGSRPSEGLLRPDEPPAPWRGLGDRGHGGEGMMGGKPYGRPMAMPDADIRDGLMLDPYTAPFGPFLPPFPPGLVLRLTLQGDLIQDAEVAQPPLAQQPPPPRADALRRIARLLRVLGLPARADRLLRAAHTLQQGQGVDVPGLRRSIARSGASRAIPPGLGRDPRDGSDVRERLRGWWQAAAGQTDAAPGPAGEPPAGLADAAGAVVPGMLAGLEWHEAVLVLNSFESGDLRSLCAVPDGRAAARRAGAEVGA